MYPSYIPTKQEDLATWATNFSALLTASPTTYGLAAGDASVVASAVGAYTTALTAALDPGTRTQVTVNTKDAARANLLAIVRPFAVNISNNPGVATNDKIDIGVNPRTNSPTPVPAPSTVPLLTFIAATPGQHTLRAADQNTPDTRGKPFGVIAMQLYAFVGTTVPTGPEDATFLGVYTKQPIGVNFIPADAGKKAYYWARWQTRTGLTGPWSTVLSQTVIAA